MARHPVGRLYHDVEKVETIGYRCLAHLLLTVPWLRRSLCTCLLPAWPVRYINIMFLVLSRHQRSCILLDNNVQACCVLFLWYNVRRRGVRRRIASFGCGFSTGYRGSVTPINYLLRSHSIPRRATIPEGWWFRQLFRHLTIQPTYSRSKIHEADSLGLSSPCRRTDDRTDGFEDIQRTKRVFYSSRRSACSDRTVRGNLFLWCEFWNEGGNN